MLKNRAESPLKPSLFFLIFFLFLWATPVLSFAVDQHKLFIVHSYEAENICGAPQEAGILQGLADNGFVVGYNLQLEHFYMDTKRNHTSPVQIEARGRAALAAIAKFRPDVVITLDDNAADQVMLPLAGSDTPVVFSGINNTPEYYNSKQQFMNSRGRPGSNVTGVYEKLHVAKALQVMKEIVPGLKRIVVLVDESPTGQAIRKQVENELSGSGGETLYSFWTAHNFAEYKRMIQRINSDPAIGAYYPTCSSLDNDPWGVVTVPEITAWNLAHCRKPAMAVNFSFSRLGLLGGASVNFPAMGRQAAGKIAAVLRGEQAGNIPVEDAEEYALVFNLARARQLGVSIPGDLLGAADEVYDAMELGSPFVQPLVVVIHSEGEDGEEAVLEQGMFSRIERAGWVIDRNINVRRFYLHAEQILTLEELHKRGEMVLDAIHQLKPTVVVVIGDAAATEIMLSLFDAPYPVLFAGTHAPLSYYSRNRQAGTSHPFPGGNITGVSCPYDYVKTLEAVHIMLPEARRMAVIVAETWPWAEAIHEDFITSVSSHQRELGFPEIHFERVATMEELKGAVLRLNSDPEVDMVSVMYPLPLKGASGLPVGLQEIHGWLLSHKQKPGFSFSAGWVRHGVLIAAAMDPETTGQYVGHQLLKILGGDEPASIPIEHPGSSGLFLNQARAEQLDLRIPVDIYEAARKVYTTIEPISR